MTALRVVQRSGVTFLEAAGDGWRACFSTRSGGISQPPFAELNTSLAVGDDPAHVIENRARLGAAAGFDPAALVIARQVHGVAVTTVTAEHAGRGALSQDDALADTDALLTREPSVPLLVSTADCVPVVLVAGSGEATSIAVVHAGWRGMAAGIVQRAAAQLAECGGPLTAGIVGPSIGPCCFAVSDDVGTTFQERFPGTWSNGHVDLWAAATQELADAGLAAEQFVAARLCTVCDERFFSHRRDAGRTGRQATVAWLMAPGTPAE